MSLYKVETGYYWAYYKDHGWIMLEVYYFEDSKLVYEMESPGTSGGRLAISKQDWGKYNQITPIRPPDIQEI